MNVVKEMAGFIIHCGHSLSKGDFLSKSILVILYIAGELLMFVAFCIAM